MDGFRLNVQGRSDMTQGRNDYILGVIRITVWIQESVMFSLGGGLRFLSAFLVLLMQQPNLIYRYRPKISVIGFLSH